jgi:hypothetical protein
MKREEYNKEQDEQESRYKHQLEDSEDGEGYGDGKRNYIEDDMYRGDFEKDPWGFYTQATVGWYNEKTGERWRANHGGYSPKEGTGWVIDKGQKFGEPSPPPEDNKPTPGTGSGSNWDKFPPMHGGPVPYDPPISGGPAPIPPTKTQPPKKKEWWEGRNPIQRPISGGPGSRGPVVQPAVEPDYFDPRVRDAIRNRDGRISEGFEWINPDVEKRSSRIPGMPKAPYEGSRMPEWKRDPSQASGREYDVNPIESPFSPKKKQPFQPWPFFGHDYEIDFEPPMYTSGGRSDNIRSIADNRFGGSGQYAFRQ